MLRRVSFGLVFALMVTVVALIIRGRDRPPTADPPPEVVDRTVDVPIGDIPQPPQPCLPPLLAAGVDKLVDAGWNEATAEAVVTYHRDWLLALFAEDRDAYDRTVILLGQMPDADQLQGVLAERPALAGLLLLVDDPAALARELDGRDAELLASLFVLHSTRSDARILAGALPGNGPLIADLYRRGLFGAEVVFLFDRETRAAREYEQWVHRTLRNAIALSDEELAGVFLMVLEEGPAIRRMMTDDDAFRVRFPGMWAKLGRIVRHRNEDYGYYIDQPGLWTFLAHDDAESLMTKWGVLPADLLAGDSDMRYPPELHPRIKDLLRAGDPAVINLLLLCRGERAIDPILQADLPADLLRGVSADLFAHRADLRSRLESLQRKLSDSPERLAEVVGTRAPGVVEFVPFYSVYKVYQSYSDGDDPSTLDVVFAAAELGTVAVPGGKLAVEFGKQSVKAGFRAAAKKAVITEVEAALRGLGAGTAKKFGPVVANKYAARIASKRWLGQLIRKLRLDISPDASITVGVRIDITNAMKSVYGKVGHQLFPRFSRLQPKILLSGKRVHLHIGLKVDPKVMLKDLMHTTEDEPARGDSPTGDADTVEDAPDWVGPVLWLASAVDLSVTREDPAANSTPPPDRPDGRRSP